MLNANIKTVRNDMNTLVKDAQELFREAGLTTGQKADELRARGLKMLEAATEKAHDLQVVAVEKGKAAAHTTDEFVHEHPWKSIGIAAGVGLVIGMLISRR